jgi:arylsulfatase A-like enzyme
VAAATSKNGAGDDPYCRSLEKKGLLDDLAADYETRRGLADLTEIRASVLSVDDYHDTYIADRAIDFLKTAGDDRPFFLWVDFVAPHPPADAPEPYASMYKADDMRKPLSGDSSAVVPSKRRTVTEEHYRNFRAAYYGMISLLDEQVGRIVAALEADGRVDDTVIIITGDQGSMLGDFGLFGKGVFYKGSINSPLVIAGPESLVRQSVVDRPVQLIDLAPTILAWAGAHPGDRERCRGKSLAPLLAGSGGHPHTAAFSEDAETKLIVTERYKLASNERGSLLFDLQADPNETQNLFGKRPDLEADLLKQIKSWQSATGPTLPPNPRTPAKRK